MMDEPLTTLVELVCHRSNIRCRVDTHLQSHVGLNKCLHLGKHFPVMPLLLALGSHEIPEKCLVAALPLRATTRVGRPLQEVLYTPAMTLEIRETLETPETLEIQGIRET
jgi:hypothetical protein